jgi:hypothetical protein
MKLFRPTAILLVLLLAAMVIVPMASAAPDAISPDKKSINVELVRKLFRMNVNAKHPE